MLKVTLADIHIFMKELLLALVVMVVINAFCSLKEKSSVSVQMVTFSVSWAEFGML